MGFRSFEFDRLEYVVEHNKNQIADFSSKQIQPTKTTVEICGKEDRCNVSEFVKYAGMDEYLFPFETPLSDAYTNSFPSHKKVVEQALPVDRANENRQEMGQIVADLSASFSIPPKGGDEHKLTLSTGMRMEILQILECLSKNFDSKILTSKLFISTIITYVRILSFALFSFILHLFYLNSNSRGVNFDLRRFKSSMNNFTLLWSSMTDMGHVCLKIVIKSSPYHIEFSIRSIRSNLYKIQMKSEALIMRLFHSAVQNLRIYSCFLCKLVISLVSSSLLEVKGDFRRVLSKLKGRKKITILWSLLVRMWKMYNSIAFLIVSNPSVCPNLAKQLKKELFIIYSFLRNVIVMCISAVYPENSIVVDQVVSKENRICCNKKTSVKAQPVERTTSCPKKPCCLKKKLDCSRKCICGLGIDECIHSTIEEVEKMLSEIDPNSFPTFTSGITTSDISLDRHEAALKQVMQVNFIMEEMQKMLKIVNELPVLEDIPKFPKSTSEIALEQALEVDSLVKKTQEMTSMLNQLQAVDDNPKEDTDSLKESVKESTVYRLIFPWSSITRMARMFVWISAPYVLLASLMFANSSVKFQKEFQLTNLPFSLALVWYINVVMFSSSYSSFGNKRKMFSDFRIITEGSKRSKAAGLNFFPQNFAIRIKCP